MLTDLGSDLGQTWDTDLGSIHALGQQANIH